MSNDAPEPPKTERFSDSYEVVYSYSFEVEDVPSRANLGTRTPPTCRFCSTPSPKFKSDSHVIPAALGNRSLFSLEECHTCNDPWGSDLEDHLAKYLFLDRAVSRIRKRKGGVSYKRAPSSTSSIRSTPGENVVRVEIDESDDSVSMVDLGDNTLRLTARGQPFSPMKVAKALARLGLFVASAADLAKFEHVRKWLRGEVDYRPYFIHVFVPGTGRRLVGLRSYRHIGTDESGAPYLVQLSYSAVDLLFPFPTASLAHPGLAAFPHPGLSPYPPHVPTATRLSVVGDGVVSDMEASMVVRYQGKRELADLQYVSERVPLPESEVRATDIPPEMWEAGATGPVELQIAGRKGDVLLRTTGQMRLLKSGDDLVSIEVADDGAGWSVQIPLRSTGGRLNFTAPKEAGAPVADAIKSFRFRHALHRGAVVEARDLRDHAPLFHSEFSIDAGGATDLDGLARLYDRLEIVERTFPGRLMMPEHVDPASVRTIEFASSAIEMGEFIDTPREFYEVPMNRLSAEYIEREFAGDATPNGLKAPVHGVVQLFGEELDLGAWHVCLERPRLRTSPAALVAQLREVPETEVLWVPFAADRCILQFERYANR